jgi:AcrR family transcriptional regulator
MTFPPTPRRSPSRRGRPVVDRVLAVTLARLAEVGFARLTIPEVAQLAGVNKTSIYRRWPTKEGLVRDALAASLDGAEAPPDTGSARGDMLELARRAAGRAQSPAGMGAIRAILADGGLPLVGGVGGPQDLLGDAAVAGVLRRGVERGEFRPGADLALVASTIAGAIFHRVVVELQTADDAYLAALIDLMLDGVGAAPELVGEA